jgi:hypothetical protein
MARKIFATFPDGAVLRRRSVKDYTHAWRVCFRLPLNDAGKPVNACGVVYADRDHSESGFSSSETKARKAMLTRMNVLIQNGYDIAAHHVAPVQVE